LDLGEWNGMLRLLDLLGRWEAGDRRQEVDADSEETARELEQACPGEFAIHVRKLPPGVRRQSRSFGMNASLAITAKFTAGLSKVRFVIWEDKLTGKFVPAYTVRTSRRLFMLPFSMGLGFRRLGNLPESEMPSALHSLTRREAILLLRQMPSCGGMRRYRATLELKAKAKSKTTTKGKK